MISIASSPTSQGKVPLKERDVLLYEQTLHQTAFSLRPGDRAASRNSTPTTLAKMNTNHKLRTSPVDTTIVFPLKNYQVWRDVGMHEPLIPEGNPKEYNSNVWRSFSADQNINFSADNRGTSELIASMYPIQIPPPSTMGEYTYTRFIKYGDVFINKNRKQEKIALSDKAITEMKMLKTLTEARMPPTYTNGMIAPPKLIRRFRNLRRSRDYTSYYENQQYDDEGRDLTSSMSQTSKSTSLRNKGLLWKFSYKLNNPAYDNVIKEQNEVRRWKEENARRRRLQKQMMQQRLIEHYKAS